MQAVGAQLTKRPEDIGRIVGLIESGADPLSACQSVGISHGRFREWMRRGEDDDARDIETAYAAFYTCVTQASAIAENRMVERIASEEKDWKAQAWVVSRRNPNAWGERKTIEHSGPGGGPVSVAVTHMTDEQILERIAELSREVQAAAKSAVADAVVIEDGDGPNE